MDGETPHLPIGERVGVLLAGEGLLKWETAYCQMLALVYSFSAAGGFRFSGFVWKPEKIDLRNPVNPVKKPLLAFLAPWRFNK
jgi:hypothetical protein